MGSTGIYWHIDIINILWQCKIEIIGGVFWSITVYLYFYEKISIKKEITRLERESVIFEVIKNNIITMSESEKYSVKEMLGKMSDEFNDFKEGFREFKTEVRADIKEMIKLFHDYKLSNNERISLLEGNHKVTKRELAIYIGLFMTFAMLAVNLYISVK